MEQHSLTQNAFPLSNYQHSTSIDIESGIVPDLQSIFYNNLRNKN